MVISHATKSYEKNENPMSLFSKVILFHVILFCRTDALQNATQSGHVDGVFADHAYNNPAGNPPQLCNGKGKGRKCWDFEKVGHH